MLSNWDFYYIELIIEKNRKCDKRHYNVIYEQGGKKESFYLFSNYLAVNVFFFYMGHLKL